MDKNTSKYDFLFTEQEKEKIRQEYLDGESIRDLCIKYNIKNREWLRCKLLKDIIRNTTEAAKNAHKRHPESYKLSDDAKAKIRAARLKFMKEHPEQTAWRKSKGNLSYPEKCFIKYLKDRKIDKKYEIEREKSFFPYFADFAFEQLKLVVEIDGSQHLEEDRKEKDKKKDALLNSLGWTVIRITEDTVKHDWNEIDEIFEEIENTNRDIPNIKTVGIFKIEKERKKYSAKKIKKEKIIKIGIFRKPKKYIKKERLENGRTIAQNEASIRQRRVERPTKEELFELVKKYSFTYLSKEFGVSDKAISKWCRQYGLPYRKKDIKKYNQLQWKHN